MHPLDGLVCLPASHETAMCQCYKPVLSVNHIKYNPALLHQAACHLFPVTNNSSCMFLCLRSSCDEAFSVSLQHRETMSQACVAELTPLSSCQSYKGTSLDSSLCHLGTTEMLSLRRSGTIPPKLLAHLAEGEGADCVGPFMLRLSGAGFAHCASGPETSV